MAATDQIFISQTIIDLNLILDKFQLRNKKYIFIRTGLENYQD